MALSNIAKKFALEIRNHYWNDAPFRADKAGHHPDFDSLKNREDDLSDHEAESIRVNVVWVVAQVLKSEDPNIDLLEFAEACGADENYLKSGIMRYGLRGIDSEGFTESPESFFGKPRIYAISGDGIR